jgi:hypothetical protein
MNGADICRQCQTELMKRQVLFGRAGAIEIVCCECQASRIALKYSNTGKPEEKKESK